MNKQCKLAIRMELMAALLASPALGQLDDAWTVTVNGQTVQVRSDGTFFVPNIAAPDQFGAGGPWTAPDFISDNCLRVVGSSTVDGVTKWVTSEPFQLQQVCPNGATTCAPFLRRPTTFLIGELTISDSPPSIPVSLDMSVALGSPGTLTAIGQTTQLSVMATMANGTVENLTAPSDCVEFRTTYNTSNLSIARVDSTGEVTAVGAGTAFITAVNAGVTGVIRIVVALGDPLTTLDGFVQDENGVPLENVVVQVIGQGNSGVSDSDGRFSIPGVATTLGDIVVTGEGLAGTSAPIPPVPGALTDMGITTLTVPDTQGSEFIVVFQHNFDNTDVVPTLFLSGSESTSGIVQVPGIGFNETFSVTPGATTQVTLPATTIVSGSDTTADLGVLVTSDLPINVYGLNRKQFTTDAFAAFPVDSFGTLYRPMCYTSLSGGNNRSQFAVVASEDNTIVTITPRATTPGHPVGEPYTVNLDRLQVYQLRTSINGSDLTGSLVSSEKPVGVFSGHSCANVPVGTSFCDHLCEQMPPVDAWGRRVLTLPLETRLNGDTFRILAHDDNTCVEIDGSVSETLVLAAGESAERVLEGNNEISANAPILVTQYSHGSQWDGVNSDPFMTLIPPAEQFLTEYTFATPGSGFDANFVNIVAPSADVLNEQVRLDGAIVPPSEFVDIAGTGFSCAKQPISVGTHRVEGSMPLGIYVYGFADDDSYGYPGGLALGEMIDPTPAEDCNSNGVLDACDIEFGDSSDCNGNDVPDECDSSVDCNGNGVDDQCDLANDPSLDCDENGLLDECEDLDPSTVGACCSNSSGCSITSQQGCGAVGGAFRGVCTQCDTCNAADDCENAVAANEGVVPFTTLNSSTDGPTHPSCESFEFGDDQIYSDVWLEYTATCNGTLTVSTCEQVGGSASFDTRIAVYRTGSECPLVDADLLACNDDDPVNLCGTFEGGFRSTVTTGVVSGSAYLIRVGGFNQNMSGPGTLFVSCQVSE